MNEDIVLSGKEQRRKLLFELVVDGRLTLHEVSERLQMDYRQVRRSYKRYREEGDLGLVHRGRGRASNHGHTCEFREEVLRLYGEQYAGWGPTFACEKLREAGYPVDHETLRRWLIADGQWSKARKQALHRSWRERKAHFGELVQMDGSPHHWFGPEYPAACLMNMVDDARGVTMALMSEEETTEDAMRLLWRWVTHYGIPRALYTDRKNVYVTEREQTVEEQLADMPPLTAFGKVCATLGITIIRAHSPQAKGRVERNHGVYQDRLVKELALRGITTIEEANAVLSDGFVDGLNKRFARPAADEMDFHLPVREGLNLADVFCWEEERVVQNDWTIRHASQRYQIEKSSRPLPRPKDKVTVRTRLDRSMDLIYGGKPLNYHLLPAEGRQKAPEGQQDPVAKGQGVIEPCKSRKESPWRQGCVLMAAEPAKQNKEQKERARKK